MVNETLELTVNGRPRRVDDALPGESLLFVLRERLGLAGSKNACEEGECGSCTVRVDDRLVCSCLVLASAADGCSVSTVEGLSGTAPEEPETDGRSAGLAEVQQAFLDAGAVQCGFCTPGLLMAIDDLLERDSDPDDLVVREAISGNLCRCTGYGRILQAVELAAAARRAEEDSS